MGLRVVVVGAGLAGLAAADTIVRGGAEVVVLEARDRVGGRVHTKELPNGALVELGAEFVLPGNTHVAALAERLGLRLAPKGMRYGDREPRGGLGVERAGLLSALALVESALRARRPDAPPLSARAFLDSLALEPGAREAILARLEVSCAASADRVAAETLAGVAAHSEEDCPGVAGGNQRIALRLAEELGSVVCLRSRVERIEWSRRGVRVSAAGGELEADRAILAVPACVVSRIALAPGLPAHVAAALGRVEYGHAAKLFVPLAARPPASAVLSVPERYWSWTAAGADGEIQSVASCFAGSAHALAGLGVRDGPGAWLESLARLRPDLALEPAGAVLSTWDDDPLAGAAYSLRTAAGPGEDAFRLPDGPLHVAGEHSAGPYHALMEGALRSGVRAAQEALGRPSPPQETSARS